MYKVIEVANMLGVSKVTIYKKMEQLKKELKPHIKKKKNITYIEAEGIELIKSSLSHFFEESHPVVSELDLKKLEDDKVLLNSEITIKEEEIQRIAMNHIIELEGYLEYLTQQIYIKKDLVKRKNETLELFKIIIKNNKRSIDFIEKLSVTLNS